MIKMINIVAKQQKSRLFNILSRITFFLNCFFIRDSRDFTIFTLKNKN